jgi:hypothetical protein
LAKITFALLSNNKRIWGSFSSNIEFIAALALTYNFLLAFSTILSVSNNFVSLFLIKISFSLYLVSYEDLLWIFVDANKHTQTIIKFIQTNFIIKYLFIVCVCLLASTKIHNKSS